MRASSNEPSLPRAGATRCPRCGQNFSPDGRFCPFDAEALVLAADWDPKGDPLLGTVIDGRYEVEALIGEGGMGCVYRVRHVRLGRRFAMKALRRDLADDLAIRERFAKEARTAGSVTHPGLVEISDYGHLPDRRPFFVMELLAGYPLRSLLSRHGKLEPARAATIARRIAEALSAAHDAGIIHRDLKPDNVHIGEADTVKVVDFGLALALGDQQRSTRSNIVFGTPHYMSPEQAAGEPIGARTDVYALGVVLYEMLTGRVPFDAESHAKVLRMHQTQAPEPPSRYAHASDELAELEAVVLACLAKRPADRPSSLRELSRALGVAVPASLAVEPTSSPRRFLGDAPARPNLLRRAPVWALGLGGGLATATLGLLIAGQFGRAVPRPKALERVTPSADLAAGRPAADPSAGAARLVEAPPEAVVRLTPPAEVAPPAGRASAEGPPRKKTNAASVRASAKARSPVRDEIVDPWSR